MQKIISLSILIGCFNEAKYIQKCLLSLKDQDSSDFEVIISDNDSTDTTVEKILESIHGDERFRLHRQLDNIGAAKNAKFLLDQVQSEFVMFLGSHDYLSRGYVRNCLAKIKQNPTISISFAPTIAIDEDGNPFESNFLRVYDFTQAEPYIRYLNSVAQIVDGTPFQGIMRTKLLKQMEIPSIASVDLIIISNMLWHGVLYYSHGENYFRRFFKNRQSSYMERITGLSDSKIDRRPFFEAYLKNFDSLFRGVASLQQQIRNKMLEILCARFRDDGGAAAESMRPEPAFTNSPLKLVSPHRRRLRVLSQKVLFCTQNPVNYMSPPFLTQEQILCGPFVEDHSDGGKVLGIKTPPGEYDINSVLKRIPIEQRPDLIVVKADAARNNFPRNFSACGIPAVLILGDTTHMKSPLEVMLRYAASEPFVLYVTDHKRHHLHWFQNLGLGGVAWTPGLFVKDFEIPFQRLRDVPLSFVGQSGKFHPWRAFMLAEMEKRGIKITKGSAPQKDAASIYARSQATLNFSLNADLNLRVFEVLAAGGCLVTDRLSPQAGLDILFTPGQDFFGYDGLEDLVSLLDGLKKNPRRCLEVAEAGQKKFQERHSPDIKRKDFLETVLAGEGRGTFDLPLDPRGKVCGMRDEKSFFARVEQYEWFQERHRCGESLRIRFTSGAEMALACDLVDLPRHKVYCHDNSLPLFATAGVVGQIHEANSSMDFDVLVVGASEDIPQVGAPILISDFSVLPENEKQSVLNRMRNSGFEESEDLSGYFVKSKPIAIDVSSFRHSNPATIESAQSAFSEGRLSDAEDICREILGKDERCAGAWHLMGKMAALQGDLETAGEFGSVACELDSQNAEFIRDLADVFLRKKELEPAEQQVRRALDMAPNSPEGLVLLGRILAENDDKPAALEAFQEAIRIRKDYAEGLSYYALALQKFGRGKDAISRISKACSLAPDSVEFQTILAMLLEQNARWEDALAAYGKAARMNPDVGLVWFRQGKLLNGLRRYAEAIPILEKAISKPGVLGECFYEMGLALDMSKRFPEALEYYNKALAAGFNTAKSDASSAPRVVP